MAESLSPNWKIFTDECNPYAVKFEKNQLKIIGGPEFKTLKKLSKEKIIFDLVFIDAIKSQYQDYLESLIKNSLITVKSLIYIDNTFIKGKVYSNSKRKQNLVK